MDKLKTKISQLSGIINGNGPIVVVDDQEDIELIIRLLYNKLNAPNLLIVFQNGKDFLDYMLSVIKDQKPIPEIVFLDINMPSINGYDVLYKLKSHEKFKKIPLVMMFTSSDSPSDYEKSKKAGADGHILKPFKFSEYEELFKAVLFNLL